MQLVCSQEMHNLGYAWRSIKEQLGDEIENHIHRMTFLKGRTVRSHTLSYRMSDSTSIIEASK